MSGEFGPCVQMGVLAQHMATQYEKDTNLSLKPLLDHFMDEVEVNIAADTFDHSGFILKISEAVQAAERGTGAPRRAEFLNAVAACLQQRLEQHHLDESAKS